MSYYLQLMNSSQLVFAGEVEGVLEVGRQRQGQAECSALRVTNEGTRLDVAPLEEMRIGRRQLAIHPQADGGLRVDNLSGTVPVDIADGPRLEPSTDCVVSLPVTIYLPAERSISITGQATVDRLQTLDEATVAPGQSNQALSSLSREQSQWQESAEAEQLVRALQATMDVFQTAHGSGDLFKSAIRGAIEMAGFDRAQILLYERASWKRVDNNQQPVNSWPISQTVLQSVIEHSQTFWEAEATKLVDAASLAEVEAVIASPILNAEGIVIGALYGDRRKQSGSIKQSITRLDARLIELLACGVASGLARMEQEETSNRLRSQFEQFFTPELARELDEHPDLLEGRNADVSILFCDIRGFSRISERIGTQRTFTWINDVMEVLSECVTREQGVLVDYIGDELMAMWGAPQSQENHAVLACRSALDMLGQLQDLNRRWQTDIGEPIDLGIGVHSGPVRAGNAGSKRKFKYSPLGNTVNLASRVQGATKHLKTRLLITGETENQLGDELTRRKLADVRVVNIDQPVPLWELARQSDDKDSALCESFGKALTAFECNEFRHATRELSVILEEWPDDGPSLVLMQRAVNALVEGATPDHPVWTLGGK